ncbi:Arogenate dehydrogenase 2, chloroplastic [Porphyridium purpureum]|uniref:Arogenate dehydrogenase 2, chloroplastic n=1 Tax=Porphyridium purpureum TaxID=35688 RepID=A0A5J4YXV6_PORPP|nr:Arogenate dehydrogenase 2, chloroplastic [Porphyridium purpureum]|eukprot:POR7919..scf209_3
MKVAIVGFGTFGQFLAKTFVKQGHVVVGQSRSDYSDAAKELGAEYVSSAAELLARQPDVLILCTSIMSTRTVLERFPLDQLQDVLVVDVLSVKVYPKRLMLDMLPAQADILCTHPMFGPDSGKYSWKGLPFVYEAVRIANQPRCAEFLRIWELEGCSMVQMSCETHDDHAASTQFVTHLTGRTLANLELKSTPINTRGYMSLLGVVETTCNDSFDLFYGLYKYNPNSVAQLDRLEKSLKQVRAQLEAYEQAQQK